MIWGGVKKVTDMEKKVQKYFTQFFSNQNAKWNNKMGGRSFVITCGVIGTLYCIGIIMDFLENPQYKLVIRCPVNTD